MKYLLIGSLLGSLISSEHDTREACEGRAVILREKGASAQCVALPSAASTWGGSIICSSVTCTNTVPLTK